MEINEYQELAMRTAGGLDTQLDKLLCSALGLTGESGEFADAVKKYVYHKHPFEPDKLINELGDVCWYVALACSAFEIDLESVMKRNIEKLKKRYPDGFSPERSLNRVPD